MGKAEFIKQFDKIALLGVTETDHGHIHFSYHTPGIMNAHEVAGLISAARTMEKELLKQSASFMDEEELEHLLSDLEAKAEEAHGHDHEH